MAYTKIEGAAGISGKYCTVNVSHGVCAHMSRSVHHIGCDSTERNIPRLTGSGSWRLLALGENGCKEGAPPKTA